VVLFSPFYRDENILRQVHRFSTVWYRVCVAGSHNNRRNIDLKTTVKICLHYLLTYSMERVLLEKLTGSQLVNKFPAFYGT
jgi:hypothetical protein